MESKEIEKWIEKTRVKFTILKRKNDMLMSYIKHLEGLVKSKGMELEDVRGNFIQSFTAEAVQLNLPVVHTIRFDASNGMFDKTFVCKDENEYADMLQDCLDSNARSGNRITCFKEIV